MPAGSYTVTVTDDIGRTAQTAVTIPDESGPTLNIASLNDVSCNGGADGSIGVATVNGNAPFSYLWSNGTTAAVNPILSAGTYTVTVTDNFGCTSTLQATVAEPAAIQLAFNNTTSTCGNANGTSTVTPAGGTAPYSYLWSSGASTAMASSIAAGVHTVTVTDADGCSVSESTIITLLIPVLAARDLILTSVAQEDLMEPPP
ncbi:MAG: SprB repeat-containing protein [Bacteroidetes bacterium]|nr:SprB repeat-containing protein [Bacteroidota bacterium]